MKNSFPWERGGENCARVYARHEDRESEQERWRCSLVGCVHVGVSPEEELDYSWAVPERGVVEWDFSEVVGHVDIESLADDTLEHSQKTLEMLALNSNANKVV